MRKTVLLVVISLIAGGIFFTFESGNYELSDNQEVSLLEENEGGPELTPHPLSIELLRKGEYPGSDLEIEQTLESGSNYNRHIATYKSEGLKIYGLLTVPNGEPPEGGWPAIIFNHGYISPSVYRTTEKYVAYQDAFAKNGYVTFKSDYRGHGNSEGEARGGYGSNDYTIDVLNALSSVKKLDDVNPDKIGMWGHSMGGHITLESMVVTKDIKAGVIWAGVVGSYEDLFERWRNRHRDRPSPSPGERSWWRQEMREEYGDPEENPQFWNSLSATNYLIDISGPLQLHHGTNDESVEVEQTTDLEEKMKGAGKYVETYLYQGDDYNLSSNLSLALDRSVEFFDKYLKD
jgi:dipeptidyl aminopeptidase/acylaminoacyl peptidase